MTFTKALDMGTGSYASADDRMLTQLQRTEGALDNNALKVTQRSAGANWSVDVAAGWGLIYGDDYPLQGTFAVYNDASYNKALTTFAPASNPRIDTVVCRLYDSEVDNTKSPLDQGFIDIIVGSESAGAQASNPLGANYLSGVGALPSTAIPLAYLTIPTGAGSVTNAYITDARSISGPILYGADGSRYRLGIDSAGNLYYDSF